MRLLDSCGMPPGRVQISHIDKRPDFGLHAEMARAGYILGYDTFLRPKYHPEVHVWPLLRSMIGSNLSGQIAIGLDLVDTSAWHVSGGPGLRAIPGAIASRLRSEGVDDVAVQGMTGANIARMLGSEETYHESS